MWPGVSALTSLWGIAVRLINVRLGALAQTRNATHSARSWNNPIDGPCDCMGYMEYMLRVLRASNRIHRCHLYPLPSVETMNKPKWKRRVLESDGLFKCRCPISSAARVFANWFWLISTLNVHFLFNHYMYITMNCFYLVHISSSFTPILS